MSVISWHHSKGLFNLNIKKPIFLFTENFSHADPPLALQQEKIIKIKNELEHNVISGCPHKDLVVFK